MRRFSALLYKLHLIFLISTITTSSVLAGTTGGGSITFSLASPTAVPSLSGTMLIVLSLLLFVVAFKVTRQKGSNANKFFVMLIGVSAFGFGGSGIKLVSDAKAGFANTPIITFNTPIALENYQAYHFENSLTPTQTINILSAGPYEGSICDYYSTIEPVGVLDCMSTPSLSPGEICGIGCRSLDDGGEDLGPVLELEGKPSTNIWK
ncbi:hypothetical protein GCM10009133_24230 [Cocleimonas flava]|uniref:Uncharacterized protein n=1 Tax=Cocleimonas flava TaxID=634765 RepID=A0A4R1ENW0_9GAMM|nr:hypothetical protein [Cocleimonas flava]TCJ82957.1 hypothetical protein EV695_3695 [Cocleimonas flava]